MYISTVDRYLMANRVVYKNPPGNMGVMVQNKVTLFIARMCHTPRAMAL